MSTEAVVSQGQGIAIRMQDLSPEYAEIMALGATLWKSGYFKDVRDQAQAVTKILFGRELGFSPIVSMGGIHIIEGKPALSSNLMATLIKRSGKYDYRIKHRYPHPKNEPCPKADCLMWTNSECVLAFLEKLPGVSGSSKWETVGESSFTMDDAKAAGVLRPGGSWSKYAKAMLFARALSQGLRTYCPDVSAAPIYNPEEMGATVNEDGDVTELPASAKAVSNVPRTTAPIDIGGPAKGSAAKPEPQLEKGGNGAVKPPVTSSPAEIPAIADALQRSKGETPPEREPGSDDGDECIDIGRQTNLHKSFREALPPKTKNADGILADWLKSQGYIGKDGNGTTTTIPLTLFAEVKAAALKYAETVR